MSLDFVHEFLPFSAEFGLSDHGSVAGNKLKARECCMRL